MKTQSCFPGFSLQNEKKSTLGTNSQIGRSVLPRYLVNLCAHLQRRLFKIFNISAFQIDHREIKSEKMF